MQFSSFVVFVIFAVSIARCAPALDATTLADNAKQAQQLNAKFATLKETDPCQGQETACLNGAIATCANGKFDTSNGICPLGQRCFAIPNVRSQGTSLLCTSESTVVSLMDGARVSGGVTGSDPSTTTSSSTSSTSSTSTSTSSPNGVTVTVTVTASSASTTTTTTVSPSDASSILSQFLSSGQPLATSTSSSSAPALTAASDSNSIPPASSSGSSPPSAIVSLTAAGDSTPSPTTSSSGNVIQLTAAPNVASPNASTSTPSPSVPAGGGTGYGY